MIKKKLHNKLNISVIQIAVPIYDLTDFSFSLYSEIYLVIPDTIPPVERVNKIVEKLFNCPTSATPEGPIKTEITLTLINPANIFTKVDIDVIENTFTISFFEFFFR